MILTKSPYLSRYFSIFLGIDRRDYEIAAAKSSCVSHVRSYILPGTSPSMYLIGGRDFKICSNPQKLLLLLLPAYLPSAY